MAQNQHKTFKQAFDESIILNPNWGKYIHLCRVLSESGASLSEINIIFNEYMIKGYDYDTHEKVRLLQYLCKVAEIPEY